MLTHWWEQRSERQALFERELWIIRVLREKVQCIVLFGSAAREETSAWSDLDIIVVLDSDLPFIKRLGVLYERIQPQAQHIIRQVIEVLSL